MGFKNLRQLSIIILMAACASQIAFAQEKTEVHAKVKLVSQLVNLTIDAFPSAVFQKGIEAGKTDIRQKVFLEFSQKIDATDKYTAEQKEIIKPRLPELVDELLIKFDSAMDKHIRINDWVKESLTKNFSKDFTSAQLRRLVAYFKGPNGKNLIKFIDLYVVGGSENNANPEDSKRIGLSVIKFMETPIGDKFFESFMKKTGDDLEARSAVGFENIMNDLKKELNPETMKKMVMELLEKGAE